MAAYRQAKRMQRGALTAQGGFFTTDPALLQVPCTLRCVFVVTDILDKEQTVLDTSGGSYYPRIDIRKQADSSKYNTIIYIGGGAFYVNIELGTITEVAFSVAETEQIVYVNGELVGKKSYTSTSFPFISIGNFNRGKGNDFHGDIMLFQQFNYVLSADEIATLYNNGDPMGYVVPKAKRDGLLAEYLPQNLMESRKGPEVEPMAETYEFNIGSPYSQTVVSGRQYPFDCIYRVDYVVEEWDFQPSVYRLIGFYGESGASVVAGVSSWIRKSDAKIGEVQSCFIKMPNEGNPSILLYGDQDRDITTARRLKVTIVGITPVSVPISWLDSAKQMPLSDEYMEPLFQSIGGYDMAANGAPEILYNE